MQWDRGTWVVDGGGEWDARTSCFRAPGWRFAELGGDGVDLRSEPVAPPPLREYQQAAVDAWEGAGRRGVIVLPTGGGKTRTATAAIARAGLATLVVAPTRVLVEQWRRVLPEAGQVADGIFEPRRITIATTSSARLHADRLGPRFGLLVVDEAHHDGDEALELLPAPFRLGLTATPPEDTTRLERLVGPIVYRLSVEDLAGEWLAPFDLVRVLVDLPDVEGYRRDLASFRAVLRQFTGDGWARFVAWASRRPEGREALAAFRRTRDRVAWPATKSAAVGRLLAGHADARVLVFARDNAVAYSVAREHLVAPLTCDIGKSERQVMLRHFAEGRLRALVSARVLNEGVDVPAADVAVIVGASGGAREYVQRVGRVLRPSEGKRALVYEVVCRDTHEVAQVARGRELLGG